MESWKLWVSCKGLHVNFARDPKYSWFHIPSKNWIYCLYLHFITNNLYKESIYNWGDKTILYLIFNRINGFIGVQKGIVEQPVWTWTAKGANRKLVLHLQLRCGSLSITTPGSHLANEFDVESKLHGQVSLAAVNKILCHSWGYEWLQNSKDLLKACFENVNITQYITRLYDWL